MNRSLRALVFHGGDAYGGRVRAEAACAVDEVVVDVLAVGICGSDVHGFAGETGRRVAGMVMGHEISGVVRAAGSEVTGWIPGDRVVVNPVIGCRSCEACAAGLTNRCRRRRVIGVAPEILGGFAERVTVPAVNLVHFDATVGSAGHSGALVEPLAVALNAVRQTGVAKGDTVAVIGLGMIGLACVWAAVREGAAAVYAGDLDVARVALSERLGHASSPVTGFDLRSGPMHEQLASTGHAPAHRAVDAVGLSVTLTDAVRSVAPGGVVGMVGMGVPRIDLNIYEITTDEKSLVGSFCYSEAVFAECAAAVAAGEIDPSLFIDAVVSMDDAPAAFTRLAEQASSSIKTIVLPRP